VWLTAAHPYQVLPKRRKGIKGIKGTKGREVVALGVEIGGGIGGGSGGVLVVLA
jgi:hypothetical protein